MVSFLSPCVLPLVPGYVSYVTGSSLEELRDGEADRARALPLAIWFVLGFSTVFVALGASATLLGPAAADLALRAGAGGRRRGHPVRPAHAGPVAVALMQRDARFHLDLPGGRAIGAYLLGLAFAFGWTPCIGPVLGAILTMGASTADVGRGTALLAVYSLGLGVPFPAGGIVHRPAAAHMRRLARAGRGAAARRRRTAGADGC